MPFRPPSPCGHPGCAAIVSGAPYCAVHASDARRWDGSGRAKARQDRRALATSSAAWRGIREQVLRAEPLCRSCRQKGVLRSATVADHIDGDSHNNAADNLQPLCASCHSRFTAAHDGGFGNARSTRQNANGK